MSPSGSVGLMFDILRCATFLNGRISWVEPIEIRKRGRSANCVLERPRRSEIDGLTR